MTRRSNIRPLSCPAPGKTGQRKAVSASCPPKHDKHYQRTISINLSRAISKHFSSIKCQLFCVHKNVRRHENKAMRAICYNGGNLPQAGNTKIRMSPKLQNTTNFPPKHVQPGLRQIAVMAGSPCKEHSGHLLPRTFCLSLAVWWCKIFLTCILKAFSEHQANCLSAEYKYPGRSK